MATTKTEVLTAFEIDALTGVQTIRELTADELTQRELDKAQAASRQAENDAKLAARESALAKLAALGLTADEIAAL
jgi:hypothetical protein